MTLEGLMTYGTLRACLRLLEATKSLCEVSESLPLSEASKTHLRPL